jgi:hypothetical protein
MFPRAIGDKVLGMIASGAENPELLRARKAGYMGAVLDRIIAPPGISRPSQGKSTVIRPQGKTRTDKQRMRGLRP